MAKFRMKKEHDGYIPGPHVIRTPGKPDIELKAGDEIDCDPELLKNVMHKFEAVDPFEEEKPQATNFLIVKREGAAGYFDVVNAESGKAINMKALRKAQAEELAGREYVEPRDDSTADDPPDGQDGPAES
jgi:hypothetical protein